MNASRVRRDPLALFLLLPVLALACASAPHWKETGPTAEDRESVNVMSEAIGSQGRQLVTAQSEASPNCGRICQYVANICALSEKICGIASRYATTDPMANDCVDSRSRCEQARASTTDCACRQGP